MPKSTDDIARLVSLGASVVLDADGRSIDNLAHLVSIAVEKGATLTIRNASEKSTEDLERLASMGGDKVVLDLS
jgi:hypothetical protein